VEFPEPQEIRKLLLNPSAANIAAANARLESLASFVTSAKDSIESGQKCDPRLRTFLLNLRLEMARMRNLLDSAAKFFNGLNSLQHAAGYQRNGLLSPERPGRRTLAHL
jgi:hypothetical protein